MTHRAKGSKKFAVTIRAYPSANSELASSETMRGTA